MRTIRLLAVLTAVLAVLAPGWPTTAAVQSSSAGDDIVATEHQVVVDGKSLRYTARAGTLPIRSSETGEIHARMFFTAYTVARRANEPVRPLTFLWNGGPGSSSSLVHLLGFGPRRLGPDRSPDRQPGHLARFFRSRLRRSDRHRLQPAGEGRMGTGVLPDARRCRIGWRVHSHVPQSLRGMGCAGLPGGRELRCHARGRRRRRARAPRHSRQRSDPDRPRAAARSTHRRAAHRAERSDLHGGGVHAQEASAEPPDRPSGGAAKGRSVGGEPLCTGARAT